MSKKIINGTVDLSHLWLRELPEWLSDVTINGDFECHFNQLTSLKNAPKYVGGHFYCGSNKLTSLEGAPKRIDGGFSCYRNKLTSLKGAPEYIGKSFSCSYNQLISLEGCPKFVGEDFWIRDNNPGNFTRAQIRAVCDVRGAVYVE